MPDKCPASARQMSVNSSKPPDLRPWDTRGTPPGYARTMLTSFLSAAATPPSAAPETASLVALIGLLILGEFFASPADVGRLPNIFNLSALFLAFTYAALLVVKFVGA